jgi:flagellar biosynthetic protein FliR
MPITNETVQLTFLIFCRIAGCLMLMPGFSSARVPQQIRLFIVLAITLGLAPLLLPLVKVESAVLADARFLWLVVAESVLGAVIGLCGRFFYMSLQFAAVAAANFIGITTPSPPIDDIEALPPAATLITLTATVAFFLTIQHWDVLRALIGIYAVLPVTEIVPIGAGLDKIMTALADSFALTLQLTSPFLVYSLVINLMFGIANKFTPQIPVAFTSTPFVYAGGALLLFFTVGEVVRQFIAGFASWLARV